MQYWDTLGLDIIKYAKQLHLSSYEDTKLDKSSNVK